MKFIRQLKKKDLSGKTVLLRADFNVPIKNGKVEEDYRIEHTLPTINYLQKNGARIILMSHLGDDGSATLAPVAKYLTKFFPTKLEKTLEKDKISAILAKNEVVLLENLRGNDGEKKNDLVFAKKLASLADLYVNDAFAVCHRAHASVVGVPKFLPSCAGFRLEKEISNLAKVFKPKLPFVVILGGIKFQTKIPLIKKLEKNADKIFLGGALANSFYKAKGFEVGQSTAEDEVAYLKPFLKNKKLVLPVDVEVLNKKTNKKAFKKAEEVTKDEMIVDVGSEGLKAIAEGVKKAKTILWNGPFGWFELGYKKGTLEIAKILASSKAFSVVGGGDTLASIKTLKLMDKFGFVSTGGGAMLDFIGSGGNLPGIKALK